MDHSAALGDRGGARYAEIDVEGCHMIRIVRRAALLIGVLLLSLPASAQQTVQVEQVWSRAALAGRNGAVYLTIKASDAPDRLIGADSPVAEKIEMHESIDDQGVIKMREVGSLPMAAGQSVTLAPGGHHIMLMRLKQALNEGDRIPLTLKFEKAGAISATALVGKAGAPAPASAEHGTHGHGMHGHGMHGGAMHK